MDFSGFNDALEGLEELVREDAVFKLLRTVLFRPEELFLFVLHEFILSGRDRLVQLIDFRGLGLHLRSILLVVNESHSAEGLDLDLRVLRSSLRN